MKLNFKRVASTLEIQPGRGAAALGLTLIFFSLLFCAPLPYLVGVAVLGFGAVWQKIMQRPVGENFAVLPSIPILDGKPYYFLYQRRRKDVKDKPCQELMKSLIRDKGAFVSQLPVGLYYTITHDNVVRILQASSDIRILTEPTPVYQSSLQSILLNFTKGRCKRCERPCQAWNSPARDFYLVTFEVGQEAAARRQP